MASGNTHADAVLNVFRNTAYAARTSVWISLHTGDPGATGASEVSTSGTAYARVEITSGQLDAPGGAAGSRQIVSNAIKSYAEATGGGFGTVTHLGIWDAASAGNFLAGGVLDTSKAVPAGAVASFAVGDARIRQA